MQERSLYIDASSGNFVYGRFGSYHFSAKIVDNKVTKLAITNNDETAFWYQRLLYYHNGSKLVKNVLNDDTVEELTARLEER